MKTKYFANIAFVLFALSILTIAYSCSDTTVTPPVGPAANTISGTVTFADTNFGAVAVGYYDIAAFSSWPPAGPPAANDSLIISKVDGKYKANYTIKSLGVGVDSAKYTIAIGWRRRTGGASPTMGIYPCDTAHYNPVSSPCPFSPTPVTIRNNAGVTGINILSWADTTKRVF